ncbi:MULTISPECIES: carbamoyltransferase HypF [unclassified Streptomyces]|uniref:carbamoyltransferase HypF n=1 Tax=unclassified Streptomyces TaxID=2593676 RepID=UPI00225BF96D|nr:MULTISPECIES: carbamoyltransferase HypF [unclassified Streptomyces]MCX4992581.1 carbamoyltransferase HypF [Streptomyces sp. NBC_00568]MCX5002181.1 carbamoyltransferase HypF [Streptomyces sp. NBC_00638]
MKRTPGRERRHVTVTGVVQGVGFRPFVYTLAEELGLTGWVTNNARGVEAEVEGPAADVETFCVRIGTRPPPLAVVESVEHRAVPLENDGSVFTIRPSSGGPGRTLVSPDTATCDACLGELADPADRRYRHPFITCTHCGPRFTIVTSLPYDRDRTTMAGFPMCADCAREYTDPADRRFHAQPIACPACGPRLTLRTGPGDPGELRDARAITEARRLLAEGAVLAVKGIGGYHLACDAGDPAAVRTLRKRKNRGGKPFAVLADSLETVRRLAHVGPEERELLLGPRKPVVLLRRRAASGEIAAGVAPGSPDLGFMLPYTPVHRLLLGLPGDPPGPAVLVMTSGNRSGEPIVTDDAEALTRLAGLADAWLAHDRPIHVPCDDSVVRVCAGAELPVRRSRGYAPFPIALPVPVVPALAVGGDLKNTFCAGDGRYAWLSAHVGDMDDLATLNAFERATGHLTDLTAVEPRLLITDRHPGYRSTQWARRAAEARGLPLRRVQHHHAHVASAMAEHGLDGSAPVIGIAFDGTGYGDDGAVWGGEVLLADYDGYRRFAHLGYTALPGGDAAVRNPYRMALSHLRTAGLPWSDELPCAAAATPEERRLLERQLERGFNCVPTSSMGRLFDAVSSLAGVCHRVEYEAQAAMELENAALDDLAGPLGDDERNDGYRFMLRTVLQDPEAPLIADPAPVLAAAVADVRAGVTAGRVARRFHRAVVALVQEVCTVARERTGIRTVALSGGVFCNALLTEGCGAVLERDGFTVLRHHRVPPNDGGLALGQLIVAARARD